MVNHVFILDKVEVPPVTGERKIVIELAKHLSQLNRDVYLYSDIWKGEVKGTRIAGLREMISLSLGGKNTIFEYHVRSPAFKRTVWTKFLGDTSVIYSFMGGDLNYIFSSKNNISLRLFERTVDKLLIVAEYQRQIIEDFLDVDVVVIPPFVDEAPIKKNQHFEKNENIKLLFMGIPSRNKGFEVLLKAYAIILNEYPDACLIIADSGENPEASIEAQKLIRRLNLQKNIDYVGVVNALEILSKVDLFVYPARTIIDTMAIPLSILEALSIGTPAVSANIGGVSEILPSDYVAETDDHLSLLEAMRKALRNKNPPPLPSRFLKRNVINMYLRLYETLIK